MYTNKLPLIGLALGVALWSGCGGDDGTSESTASGTESSTDTDSDGTTAGTTMGSDSQTSNTMTDPAGTDSDSDSTDSDPTDATDTDTETGVTDSDSDTEPPAECGNGVLEQGEECDDGNNEDGDGCSADCAVENNAECGNGEVEQGEDCDDGNTEPGDGCDENCNSENIEECGNGIAEGGEECDDGNDVPDDGCEADCTTSPSECGNGITEPWGNEECDDGNDVPQDGCENNCTITLPPSCQPPENYIVCDQNLSKNDPMAPFQAIGIGCSQDPLESIIVSNTMFQSSNPNAWQIAKGFGTYIDPMDNERLYSPEEGESFIIISSGLVSAPNGQGIVTEANGSQVGNGDNQNDDSNSLPMGMSPQVGSNNGNGGTPGMNCAPDLDCSDSLLPQWNLGQGDPNDKIWFSWTTTVPTGVLSYSISFVYFSAEWPVYYNTVYNDLLIIWESSEDYWGNISVIDDKPTTITALGPYWTMNQNPSCNGSTDGPGYTCNEPQLQGTGFEGHAGSDWITINRPITENENLRVFVFLADMRDSILATGAIIDAFRWNCDECIPADDPLCTGEVPDPNCCGVILPM